MTKRPNFHSVCIYWHWRLGRFSFMVWWQGKFHWNKFFFRRSDGGWVLHPLPDVSLVWEGKD
jgi:hypothetical protein